MSAGKPRFFGRTGHHQCGTNAVEAHQPLPSAPLSTRVVVLPFAHTTFAADDAGAPKSAVGAGDHMDASPLAPAAVTAGASAAASPCAAATGDATTTVRGLRPYAPVSWAIDPYGFLLTDSTQTLAPSCLDLNSGDNNAASHTNRTNDDGTSVSTPGAASSYNAAASPSYSTAAAGSPPPLVSLNHRSGAGAPSSGGGAVGHGRFDADVVTGTIIAAGGGDSTMTTSTTETMRLRSWHRCAVELHQCRRKEHRGRTPAASSVAAVAAGSDSKDAHRQRQGHVDPMRQQRQAANASSSASGTPSASAGTPAAHSLSPAPPLSGLAGANVTASTTEPTSDASKSNQFVTTRGSTAAATVARREERDWARNMLHHVRLRVRREKLSTAERGVAWPLLVGAAPLGTPAYDKLERYVSAVERIEGSGFAPAPPALDGGTFSLEPEDAPGCDRPQSESARDSGRLYNAPRLTAEVRDLIARDLSRTLPTHLLFRRADPNTSTARTLISIRSAGEISDAGGLSPSVSGQGSPKMSHICPTENATSPPIRSPTTGSGVFGDVGNLPPLSSIGQTHLRRVLYAVCAHDAEVGYCQGMGFIAATLLLHLPDAAATGVLLQLMHGSRYRLCDLYRTGFPLLQRMMIVLRKLLRYFTPRLSEHLNDLGVDVSFFASNWFLTLFAYQFPTDLVARVWDLFFSEGWVVMFRVAVGLLIADEEQLLRQDMEGLLTHLKSIHEYRPPGEVVRLAMDVPIFESDLHYLSPPPPPSVTTASPVPQQQLGEAEGCNDGNSGRRPGALSAARLAAHAAHAAESSSSSESTAASPLLIAAAGEGSGATNLLSTEKGPFGGGVGRTSDGGVIDSDTVSASGVTIASDTSSAMSSQRQHQAGRTGKPSVKFAFDGTTGRGGMPPLAPLSPAQLQAQQAAASAALIASVRKIQSSTAELRAASLMREFGLLDDAGLTAAMPGVDAWMRLQGLLPVGGGGTGTNSIHSGTASSSATGAAAVATTAAGGQPPPGPSSYFNHFADCGCATCLHQEAAGLRPRAVVPIGPAASASPTSSGDKSPSLLKRLFATSAAEKERQRRELEQLAAADFEARQRASARAAVGFIFDPLRESASLGAFGPRGPPPTGVPAAIVGRFP